MTLRISAIALGLALVLAGCTTPQTPGQPTTPPAAQQFTCATAALALGIYRDILDAKEDPEPEQIIAAKRAAEFLSTVCGWTGTRSVDKYGVPILRPPSRE